MSSAGSNALRMPFAEWLFRMSEANVPYQARSLAVYAVLFKVSANDELAKLSGMDTKGLADKTYNKWKRLLSDDGWIILKSVTIGRSTAIEVYPAFKTKPVTFTDVASRDPARFAQNKSYGREEQITGESYGRTVEVTDETEKVTVEKVTFTAEGKTSPAPAHAEINNNIYNNNNNLTKKTISDSSEQVAARDPDKIDYNALSEQLVDACNGALDNPVNCQGLASLAIPLMWMREGCDLQADIIPTLVGYGKSAHGKRIRSWDYFTGGVTKARDARIKGLPTGSGDSLGGNAKESKTQRMKRIFAKAGEERGKAQ